MTRGNGLEPSDSELRRRAERQLEARPTAELQLGEADARRLVHELEVHQIELEMQNEELRAARHDVEVGLKRYTELFDFAPIGYLVLRPDGIVSQANLAGATLLGLERQRLTARRFLSFVSEGQKALVERFLARVLARASEDTGSESCEVALLGDQGAALDVRLTACALEGSPRAALVALEDISARQQAEEALRQELRNKDEFLAVLSHELRNPLAPVRSALFVLARAPAGGEQALRALSVIDRQVSHLTRIVDDLLDATRIARGKVSLQRERVELGELVRRTMDDHRDTFEQNGINLEARFDSELFWVDADPTRLVQVVGNLLANAAKFTPRNGQVDVDLRRDGPRAALSLRDTGVGIAPELRAHLFEPFWQAPQALDRSRGGLGLGLAMVKGLVELHGGSVDVMSEGLGRGAEFIVRLPLGAEPADHARPTRRAGEHGGRRVLVIEDNVDAANSLRDALELDGHDVRVAHDGLAGLSLARELSPEVVICDIGLPGMTGFDVARAFRADGALKDVYLVALSGYALPDDIQQADQAGFDRHIAKPPSLDKLAQLFAEMPN